MNRRGADRIGPLGSSGVIAQWGGSSLVESVQFGSTNVTGSNTTADTTITAVDYNRSFILGIGGNNNGVDNWGLRPNIQLFNATTVRASRGYQDGTNSGSIYWVVVQWRPGVVKSIQYATLDFSAISNPTATITSVNTAKTFVSRRGETFTNLPGTSSYIPDSSITLSNATTLQGQSGGGGGGHQGYATVIEFF